MWKIKEASEYSIDLEDPKGWYSAFVKWDGCIDYRRYFNEPLDMQDKQGYTGPGFEDYIHICDIDEEIARLQEIKSIALKHFAERFGGWPG